MYTSVLAIILLASCNPAKSETEKATDNMLVESGEQVIIVDNKEETKKAQEAYEKEKATETEQESRVARWWRCYNESKEVVAEIKAQKQN